VHRLAHPGRDAAGLACDRMIVRGHTDEAGHTCERARREYALQPAQDREILAEVYVMCGVLCFCYLGEEKHGRGDERKRV
jgi:hypothetical protein